MVANRKQKNKLNEINKLIRLYRANECLWNPKSPGFQNVALKENAWHRISQFFENKLTVDQVKLQILSLRYYFATELLDIKRSQLGGYKFVPRHPYFNELKFLRGAMVNNVHVGVNEAKDQVNKQINCLVEDAFLLSNSENSIHSEQIDFPTYESDEDAVTESLALPIPGKSLQAPLPQPNIDANQLQSRVLSGNDRWNTTSNFVTYAEKDIIYERRRAPYPARAYDSFYSICSEDARPNFDQRPTLYPPETNPAGSTNSFIYNSYADSPRASGPPKKKVLTGRYRQKSRPPVYGAERDIDFCQRNNDNRVYQQHYRYSDGRESNRNDFRYVRNSRDLYRKKSNDNFKNQYQDNIIASCDGASDLFVNNVNVPNRCLGNEACDCCANCQLNTYNDDQIFTNCPRNRKNENQWRSQEQYPQLETDLELEDNMPTRASQVPCNDAICPERTGRITTHPAYDNPDAPVDQQPYYESMQNGRQQQNDQFINEYEESRYPDKNEQIYNESGRYNMDNQDIDQRIRTANNNMEVTTGAPPNESARLESRRASTSRATPATGSKPVSTRASEDNQRVVCTNDRKKLEDVQNTNLIKCTSESQRSPERKSRRNDDLMENGGKTRTKCYPANSSNEENGVTQSRRQQRQVGIDSTYNPDQQANDPEYYCKIKQVEPPQRRSQRGDEEGNERYSSENNYIEEHIRIYRDDDPRFTQSRRCSVNGKENNRYERTGYESPSRKYNDNPQHYQTGQDDCRRRDDDANRPKYQDQYRGSEAIPGQENYGKRCERYSTGEPTSPKYQAEQDYNEYCVNSRSGQEDKDNARRDSRKKECSLQQSNGKYAQGQEYYDDPEKYQTRQANNRKRGSNNIQNMDDVECDCPQNQPKKYYCESRPVSKIYQNGQDDPRNRHDSSRRSREPVVENKQNGQDDPQNRQDSPRRSREPVVENNQNGQDDPRNRQDSSRRSREPAVENKQNGQDDPRNRQDSSRRSREPVVENKQNGQDDIRNRQDSSRRSREPVVENKQNGQDDPQNRQDSPRRSREPVVENNQNGQDDPRNRQDSPRRSREPVVENKQNGQDDPQNRQDSSRRSREPVVENNQNGQDDARNRQDSSRRSREPAVENKQNGQDDPRDRPDRYTRNREPITESDQNGQEASRERPDRYTRNREPVAENYQNGQEDHGKTGDTQERDRELEPQKYQTGQEGNEQKDVGYMRTKDQLPAKYQTDEDNSNENQDDPNFDKSKDPGKYRTGHDNYENGDSKQADPLTQKDYSKRGDEHGKYANENEMLDCECPSDEDEMAASKPNDGKSDKKNVVCLREAAVETDIDMTLKQRKNNTEPVCNCSEVSLQAGAPKEEKPNDEKIITLNENTDPGNIKQSKPPKSFKKGGKLCSCKPAVFTKNKQVAKSLNSGIKQEQVKHRSPSPAGIRPRLPAKRQFKMDDETLNSPRRPT